MLLQQGRNSIIYLIFIAFFAISFWPSNAAIFRLKRQTVVSSNANANGTADMVQTSGAAQNYKTVQGVIGVNASSSGNATGQGKALVGNSASGSAGSQSVNAVGNVGSMGTNSNSYSNIAANIFGGNMSVNSQQQGTATGVGDTSAMANGGVGMNANGTASPMNSNRSMATAGATGSLSSSSEVVMSQTLTWQSIMAQLIGSSVAQGVYNAQANIDLGAGNANNGVEVNGVVSGDNSGGGLVNAQVNGNGLLNNQHHQLTGNMYGSVNGTGNSTLVGATNLQSNVSGVNQTISAFGDSKIKSDGQSGANLISNTNLDNQGAIQGSNSMNASALSTFKNMTVNNGLQENVGQNGLLAIGSGGISGSGNQKSNASLTSNVVYNGNQDASILVNADGNSLSNNNGTSALDLNANGNLWNTNGLAQKSMSNAGGVVTGENSNITGNSFISGNSANSNGNAWVDASGGGHGSSSALTYGTLQLSDANNTQRNATVQGSVAANGDQTSVRSISVISDYAGMQSLSNYQNATSLSKGFSSASASNAGILKKRRRRQMNWLSAAVLEKNTKPVTQ